MGKQATPHYGSYIEDIDCPVQYGFVKDTLKSVLAINSLTALYISSAWAFISAAASPSVFISCLTAARPTFGSSAEPAAASCPPNGHFFALKINARTSFSLMIPSFHFDIIYIISNNNLGWKR